MDHPPPAIPIETAVSQLAALGVRPGGVLVVHTAFSKVGAIDGGPEGLIAALRAALGSDGTLVMPSMTSDDYNPFDPNATPCPDMGIVADTFWRLPGVLRSNSPHSFAAVGPQANLITAPHPIEPAHGVDSPPGRAYEQGGQVLLLGVGHEANTTVHVAESIAGVRYRAEKFVTVLRDGKPTRLDYQETDHCCELFNLMDGWLEPKGLLRHGPVDRGVARLADSRRIVAAALEHLRVDERVFLHPVGVDEDCDEAQRSLAGLPPWGDSE